MGLLRTKPLSKEAKSIVYDVLFYRGERVLTVHDPCNIRFEKGKWRCNYDLKLCCAGCKHLTPTGCGVQALTCKLYLCDTAREKSPEAANQLYAIAEVGRSLGIGGGFRTSKQEWATQLSGEA